MKIQTTSHGAPRHPGRASEDSARVHTREGRVIAALADGLGASREGGAAARRAVEMIVDYYAARPQAWSPRRALTEFASQINRIFHQESQLRHGSAELLCTLSVVVIEGARLYGFNVGDSPVYLWRRGALTCLSENHAVAKPGMEHVLTRAIGLEPQIESYVFENTIEDGDRLLLCSDGVSAAVPNGTLAELLARRASARSVVSTATHIAEQNPELRDDATAIVLDVVQSGWATGPADRPLEVLPTLRAGDFVDRFKLLRPLQESARVWLAESTLDGEKRVLKFPPIEVREDETRRDAFLREIWQATRIDSPDFIRATIPPEGTLRYYAMDYVEAPTLRSALAAGPLRVEDAVELARFLLRASQHLLARDQAHGDLKPDNILVLRDSTATFAAIITSGAPRFLLLDLGSAAEVFSVNTRAGTPSYLAPERFQGQPLSERTEIFAIGVTLYEALTRSYPYGEIERFQTPRFDTQPKRPTRLNTALPAWFESIILRALAPEPDERYQNFSEMVFDLENPAQVSPIYAKHAALLERDPARFWKFVALLLLFINFALLYWLAK
jgi:serine/threonine protein phosphatase PrpC